MKPRAIIHLDMDAFYASVEVLDHPELAGLPVIVGGSSERGVVSAASYEARTYGVHSALAIVVARRLCPHGIFRPVRMERYQEVSQQVMAIFGDYTPQVEQVSVDEAFLDVSGCTRLLGDAEAIATTIRKRVRQEIGLTVSAGIATSKLVAKIASDQDKPDGLTLVPQGQEAAFLAPLAIKRLWGVGKKTIPSLNLLGVYTIGDLCRFDLDFLERKFGKQGRHMYFCARGLDLREVETTETVKSIGNEETFAEDLIDLARIKKELLSLTTKVGERLRDQNLKGQTVTLKIKYHDFSTVSRSVTLEQATNDSRQLYTTILALLPKTQAGVMPVRLAGLSVSKLTARQAPCQLGLFEQAGKQSRAQLTEALDAINRRYGSLTIKPALLVDGDDKLSEGKKGKKKGKF
ncbi:MAG: DNA polymerase IV [Proteobacteria bacterium]|nr:DNA polymerase IV [Pseudomonadota bacterium]MBU1641315.1 DNA polymerase IV [Pseudomonadota bacterium]